ncbi:SRPBCC domain-containing protein [Chungangia koreensis]|uniref:SRPBCC domain-containing protein n=1 Tax=Chungangia koreensis TaxID=752657 RepID=A0ABV8X5V8_9LACT
MSGYEMLADIKKLDEGYRASLTLTLASSPEDVWNMFIDNEKLKKWFDELQMLDPKEGGTIRFNKGDGTFEDLGIHEFEEQSVLAFDWFGELVKFHLTSDQANTLLNFTEEFRTITDQTAKDIAGWHVCLLVIEGLLDGPKVENRMSVWQPLYEKYKKQLAALRE